MPRPCFPVLLLAVILSFNAFAQQTQGVPQFTVSTIAGTGVAGFSGDNGPALKAELNNPFGVALDAAGNLYIADFLNERVRKVAPDGTITTFAGNGQKAFGGDGGPAVNASLNRPSRISIDTHGNLLLTDPGNNRVRKITPDGTITTIAGSDNATESGDGGLATSAGLNYPASAIADAAGNIYISDSDSSVIRKVDVNGIISTIGGTGAPGYSGDGGPATQAALNNPVGLALSANGDLFIADQSNHRIRKISNGIITTVAGTGIQGFSGDGGLATSAKIANPSGPVFDAAGNLYFAELTGERIRVLLTDGTIATVAGSGVKGFNDGAAAEFNLPTALAIAPSGAIYVADGFNNRIRLLTPVADIPSISLNGVVSASDYGKFPSTAPGSQIEIYGSNLASDVRGWSGSDFKAGIGPTSLEGTSITIGGKSAFVDYISPHQVNVVVPSDVPTGDQQLTLKTLQGTSAPYTLTVKALDPGFLAPSAFKIDGNQYVVAFFTDLKTYALPTGAINGLSSHPAKPGDIITLYGIGFGPVTPDIPAGELVQESNKLASDFHISIGGMPATVQYAGLAPNYTGLYQINIVVPNVVAGNAPVTFSVGGIDGTQTLFLAVGN